MSELAERIAAIISRAQQFGGMESTSPEFIADDIVSELGLDRVAYQLSVMDKRHRGTKSSPHCLICARKNCYHMGAGLT